MRPSNIIEVWSFRRTADSKCEVCTGKKRSGNAGFCACGERSHINDQRPLDSRLDLFDQNGRRVGRMPDILFPNGDGIAPPKDGDPGAGAFRAVLLEPVDRISIYLVATTARQGKVPGGKPAPMVLSLRLGVECIEEQLLSFTFSPQAFDDGGHLVTFATAQMWTSMVINGVTTVNAPEQRVGLILNLHNSGMCCGTQNPLYGALADVG